MLTDRELDTLYWVLTRKDIDGFREFMQLLSYDQNKNVAFVNVAKGRFEGDQYLYAQTHPDSKVLAVGHCDYVKFHSPRITVNRKKVYAGQLDDRLGVWLITCILPQLILPSCPFDILLTDNEERGNSSAAFFKPPRGKKYNWVFEFDRRGTDVALYDYACDDLEKLIEHYGLKTTTGSFTDICMLDLNCAAMNVGTGYYNEHTDSCHANFLDTFRNVYKFLALYHDCYDRKIPFNQKKALAKRSGRLTGYQGKGKFNFDDDVIEDKYWGAYMGDISEEEKSKLISGNVIKELT